MADADPIGVLPPGETVPRFGEHVREKFSEVNLEIGAVAEVQHGVEHPVVTAVIPRRDDPEAEASPERVDIVQAHPVTLAFEKSREDGRRYLAFVGEHADATAPVNVCRKLNEECVTDLLSFE